MNSLAQFRHLCMLIFPPDTPSAIPATPDYVEDVLESSVVYGAKVVAGVQGASQQFDKQGGLIWPETRLTL